MSNCEVTHQSSAAAAVLLLLLLAIAAPPADGHGRLIQPPARSTAWRYGFPTPPNYNDHETYCGGFGRQYGVNKGKCGPCGDPWDTPQPRDNEGGGKYGLGIITATYKQGAEVELGVQLTANHNGYFIFKICPHNNPKKPVSPACLNKKVLKRVDGSGARYYAGKKKRKFYMRYQLPRGLTCKQCVLQWRYITASNWGKCRNGTGMLGCGPQEEFRACADIAIVSHDGSADETPDEDYNEVETDRLHGDGKESESYSSNYAGHVVALIMAFLLLPLLLLALILYFYFAREKVRTFIKTHATFWKKKEDDVSSLPSQVKTKTTGGLAGVLNLIKEKDIQDGGRLDFPNPPYGMQPSAPPRRNRGRVSSTSSSNDNDDYAPSTIPV